MDIMNVLINSQGIQDQKERGEEGEVSQRPGSKKGTVEGQRDLDSAFQTLHSEALQAQRQENRHTQGGHWPARREEQPMPMAWIDIPNEVSGKGS